MSVEPENQATYRVGGDMAVDVDAQGAPASDMALRFGGQEYAVDSDGHATIPLDSPGTQQLAVEYEDTSETVSIAVAEREEATTADGESSTDGETGDGEASDGDDGTVGGDGPGFGVGATLAALSGVGFLVHRRYAGKDRE